MVWIAARISVKRRKARHVRQPRRRGGFVRPCRLSGKLVEDLLRIDVADLHQPQGRAEDRCRNAILVHDKGLAGRQILHGKIDRQRYRVASGGNRLFNAFTPGAKQRRAHHLHTHFGELLAHANRHCPRFVGKLARVHLRIDPGERIDVACSRRAMRGDQRNAVTARRLLQRGARERSKRCRVGDDTFLNGGFQAGRKRERANGKHRVTELQHPREKCGAARRSDAIILDGHAQNRPLPAMFVHEAAGPGWAWTCVGGCPYTRPVSASTPV